MRLSLIRRVIAWGVVAGLVLSGVGLGHPGVVEAVTRAGYDSDATYNAWSAAEVGTALYLPYINADAAWPWLTRTTVQNASGVTNTVTLKYFAQTDGSLITRSVVLPPYGSGTYTPPPGFSGSMEVDGVQPMAVSANALPLDAARVGDNLMSYRGVNAGATQLLVPLVFRNYAGWNSFLAVQNLVTATANLTLDFYSSGGGLALSLPQAVAARGAYFADVATVPGLPDPFDGWVVITSDQPVVSMGHMVNTSGQALAQEALV